MSQEKTHEKKILDFADASWYCVRLDSYSLQLKSMEIITKHLGSSLVSKRKKLSHITSYFVLLFLWLYIIRYPVSWAFKRCCYSNSTYDFLLTDDKPYLETSRPSGKTHSIISVIGWGATAAIVQSLAMFSNKSWIKRMDLNWHQTSIRIKPLSNEERSTLKKFRDLKKKLVVVITIVATSYALATICVDIITAYNQRHRLKILLFVFSVMLNFVWSIITFIVNFTTMAQFVLTCKALQIRFHEVSDDLQYITGGTFKNIESAVNILTSLQEKHFKVIEMVLEANSYWKKYIFFFYLIFIPQVCFLSYQTIFGSSDILERIIIFVWTFGGFTQVAVVSLSAAAISTYAHHPHHFLYGVSFQAPENIKAQVKLFLRASTPFSYAKFTSFTL